MLPLICVPLPATGSLLLPATATWPPSIQLLRMLAVVLTVDDRNRYALPLPARRGIYRSMVTLVAPLSVLPVRLPIRAVPAASDFNVRFCAFRFNDAVANPIVPYTSSAEPSVTDAPLLTVRLFNDRVAALVWLKFKVPAIPLIIRPEVDDPVNVPVPVTAPLIVRFWPARFTVVAGLSLILPTVIGPGKFGLEPVVAMVRLVPETGTPVAAQLDTLFQVASAVPYQVYPGTENFHTGPVVVLKPSDTSTYHSYSSPSISDGQLMQVCVPETTFRFVPNRVKGCVRFTGKVNWLLEPVKEVLLYGE